MWHIDMIYWAIVIAPVVVIAWAIQRGLEPGFLKSFFSVVMYASGGLFVLNILVIEPSTPPDAKNYSRCVEMLSGVKVAEEMYLAEYGVGTDDPRVLSQYMIADCEIPEERDELCDVRLLVNDSCEEFKIELNPDKNDYVVSGIPRETSYNCRVCVTPEGYWPDRGECYDMMRDENVTLPNECPVYAGTGDEDISTGDDAIDNSSDNEQ